MEILTRAIANEYRDRALLLPSNGLQAVNIINGFHIPDYVRIAEVRAAKEAEEHEN